MSDTQLLTVKESEHVSLDVERSEKTRSKLLKIPKIHVLSLHGAIVRVSWCHCHTWKLNRTKGSDLHSSDFVSSRLSQWPKQ